MRNELSPDATPRPNVSRPVAHHRWRYRAGAFGVIGVAALVAAGCGSSSKASTASAPAASAPAATAPAATAAPTTAAPAAVTPTTGAAATAAGTKITATLTEFKITLSQTKLAPGTYTFDAVNAGHTVHALEIDGPGVDDKATPGPLQPGQSAELTVTLKAGKYDVYCPVGDHKALGMNLELTVAGTASAAGAAPAKTAATTSGGGSGY